MRRRHLLGLGVAGLAALRGSVAGAPARAAGPPVVGRLTWFGQSCFLLETAAGSS